LEFLDSLRAAICELLGLFTRMMARGWRFGL